MRRHNKEFLKFMALGTVLTVGVGYGIKDTIEFDNTPTSTITAKITDKFTEPRNNSSVGFNWGPNPINPVGKPNSYTPLGRMNGSNVATASTEKNYYIKIGDKKIDVSQEQYSKISKDKIYAFGIHEYGFGHYKLCNFKSKTLVAPTPVAG